MNAGHAGTVAVVIPSYNHAHYLGAALDSVMAQTRPPDEIVVVDDGSDDDPAAVVARYPGVRLIRQANTGLSAARNAGLAAITSRYVNFLDADDLLTPDALARNLSLLAAHPGAAFAYGGYDKVRSDLSPLSGPHYLACDADAHATFLFCNAIGMHATVLYDAQVLREAGGFDTSLHSCEDYDVYLRLTRQFPVLSHSAMIAHYRIHDANMSANAARMLRIALSVQNRYRPAPEDTARFTAWRRGRRHWRGHYLNVALKEGDTMTQRIESALPVIRLAPLEFAARTVKAAARRLLGPLARWLGYGTPPPGRVRMGSLKRLRPIGRDFGFERGTPIDRYYIDAFLASRKADFRGRALEIGDASYCRQFDSGITRQDVLHVHADNPDATIVGDISQPGTLPESSFDCLVITQTLHLIYDMKAVVEELRRSLRPGGVLLLTVPGITPIDRGDWNSTWYWSLTGQSATRLFGEVFGPDNIEVEVHGNVYAATCFLQGMALEEVRRDWLDVSDPCYPVTITVCAVRQD